MSEQAAAGPTAGEEWIVVARIVRPQANRGEVLADLLTDYPERFAALDIAQLVKPNGEHLQLKLERYRRHKERVVFKFAGYDTINQAETLRGARLLVARDQLIKLPADHYYDFDLVDCAVETVSGAPLGRVTGVQSYGAAPLLVVRGDGQREFLIPLALSICKEIDIAGKRIVVDPPEGLLEL